MASDRANTTAAIAASSATSRRLGLRVRFGLEARWDAIPHARVAGSRQTGVSPEEDPLSTRGGTQSSFLGAFRRAGAGAYGGRMTAAADSSATNTPVPGGLLARLADLAYRRRGRMVLAWIAALAAAVALAPRL